MTVFNRFSNDCSTMEAQKGVFKSILLSAATTLLLITIYATFCVGPGYWEPNDGQPAESLFVAKASNTAVSRMEEEQQNNLPGFGSWFDGCKSVYLDGGSNRGVQIRKPCVRGK
jgi:hypothetical protein